MTFEAWVTTRIYCLQQNEHKKILSSLVYNYIITPGTVFIFYLQYPESLIKHGLGVCDIIGNGERSMAEVGL